MQPADGNGKSGGQARGGLATGSQLTVKEPIIAFFVQPSAVRERKRAAGRREAIFNWALKNEARACA